jgi:hypothetical protein
MSTGGVSGQGKLSIRGGMLEGHYRCQEALSILGGSGPLQRFGPPSGDLLKVSKPVHSWAKNAGKSLPC